VACYRKISKKLNHEKNETLEKEPKLFSSKFCFLSSTSAPQVYVVSSVFFRVFRVFRGLSVRGKLKSREWRKDFGC
tara:strand:- start:336 stop:563 length:228 start_codon:yes stop_codon:yes gene_type:complete